MGIQASGAATAWKIGVRAHDFGRATADEMAQRIAAAGFSCVQLAVNKALSGPDRTTADLTPEFASATRAAFDRHGVEVAVLGCYINPIQPREEVHQTSYQALLAWYDRHLEVASQFGCKVVALESGSLNHDYSPHPENHGPEAFVRCVQALRHMTGVAEKSNVFVGIEGVTSHTLNTPKRLNDALDAVDSKHIAVVFDPVNFLSARNHTNQRAIIDEALTLFGDRVVAVHLKDFVITGDALRPALPGEGLLDYAYLFQRLSQTRASRCLLLEEVPPAAAERTLQFVRRHAA